jgi:hypothetical protein
MKTLGVVGSRRRNEQEDFEKCYEAVLKIYKKGDKFVSGGCPKGGDRFAEIIAKRLGATIIIHYPDWKNLGKSAGFQRNSKIASDCDILIAVVADDRTGGTEDTITKAEGCDKKVILV